MIYIVLLSVINRILFIVDCSLLLAGRFVLLVYIFMRLFSITCKAISLSRETGNPWHCCYIPTQIFQASSCPDSCVLSRLIKYTLSTRKKIFENCNNSISYFTLYFYLLLDGDFCILLIL